MTSSLKVILWGEEIGRLAWDNRRRLAYFMYNPEWIKRGLNISPLVAPIDGARSLTPVWGEDARIYQKLPAFVADSLPDAWGNQLFDLWRQQNHLSRLWTNSRSLANVAWEPWSSSQNTPVNKRLRRLT